MYKNQTNQLAVSINKDVVAGVLFFGFAAVFGYMSTFYPMGRAAQMGPGYYPALLSGALAFLGIALTVTGSRKPSVRLIFVRPTALIAVLATPLVFALTLRPLGFVPAVALASWGATIAAPVMSVKHRALSAACLATGCTAVFIWALGAPLPLFGYVLVR
ncbi:tripartite tricarboxylate transporter TctB family protein [Agrobacterium pusense]|uniref:tripartite tricarboxylate transporter TctB family protein n=1 Tax=Agrobacterium pusense TaxID=648995 RepID=UPI001C6E016D|nr:tripartite tricarboxylate transporter TctB family protein [Agrobacterium pusense]MBW9071289.1 tripartite tricarboxylate transporter TctB family protein [Agrobacterium pusense]MBW9084336.1 tripartite tricarboxylate transporter TctB family protein [Agrobacterium pusense]MBW9124048.1 tripartite tricarboxylate transporter TctB family protein [Agrobacterium pusense]MBW9137234.1 tripartite tricarboxylate transporter TctB family protein [Agrobacterium pusense]